MKFSIHGIAATAAIALLMTQVPVHAALKLPRPSSNASVKQTIGLTDITVTYSRPGVKGRTIWGELEQYGKPWRSGANEATTVTFSEDVKINGKALPAGTYSFFTIPNKDTWQAVFNKEKDLWGAYAYKPEQDAIKMDVVPAAAENQEWLQYSFENLKTNSADLVLRWEKVKIVVPIETDDVTQALDHARAEVAAAKPDDWTTLYRAADFLWANGVESELAAQWAQKSVTIEPGYLNLSLLAKLRAKEGKKKEAMAHAEKAIKAGKEGTDKFDTRPTEKLLAEWSAGK